MGIHVALLRGINVGGKHKLPMKLLAPLFEAAGCREVSTYIQSGNVIFEGTAACARAVSARVSEAIEREFGFPCPVVLRSHRAFREAMVEHPFADAATDPKLIAVGFLDRKPTQAAVRELDAARFVPDRFEVRGSEVYLHYPNGVARSKLTNAYLDRTLKATCTARNWNTASKLLELCDARV